MALMRLKLIEQVDFKKVPSARLFSTKKVWGKQIAYELFLKEFPYDTGTESRKDIIQCRLRIAADGTGDDLQYWYVMQKSDREKAEAKLRRYLEDRYQERWDVSDFAKETLAIFDEPRKFWVCAYSRQKEQVTKEAEEKMQSKVLQDAVLTQSA